MRCVGAAGFLGDIALTEEDLRALFPDSDAQTLVRRTLAERCTSTHNDTDPASSHEHSPSLTDSLADSEYGNSEHAHPLPLPTQPLTVMFLWPYITLYTSL